MAEQMEQINVEEIMQDIRTQIAERGYTKNELKFADVAAKAGEISDEIDDYFELDHFGLTVERMNSTRKVQCWRLIGGNRLAVFSRRSSVSLSNSMWSRLLMNRISSIFIQPRQ